MRRVGTGEWRPAGERDRLKQPGLRHAAHHSGADSGLAAPARPCSAPRLFRQRREHPARAASASSTRGAGHSSNRTAACPASPFTRSAIASTSPGGERVGGDPVDEAPQRRRHRRRLQHRPSIGLASRRPTAHVGRTVPDHARPPRRPFERHEDDVTRLRVHVLVHPDSRTARGRDSGNRPRSGAHAARLFCFSPARRLQPAAILRSVISSSFPEGRLSALVPILYRRCESPSYRTGSDSRMMGGLMDRGTPEADGSAPHRDIPAPANGRNRASSSKNFCAPIPAGSPSGPDCYPGARAAGPRPWRSLADHMAAMLRAERAHAAAMAEQRDAVPASGRAAAGQIARVQAAV